MTAKEFFEKVNPLAWKTTEERELCVFSEKDMIRFAIEYNAEAQRELVRMLDDCEKDKMLRGI